MTTKKELEERVEALENKSGWFSKFITFFLVIFILIPLIFMLGGIIILGMTASKTFGYVIGGILISIATYYIIKQR